MIIRLRYIYCVDNVLDHENLTILQATKEALELKIANDSSQSQTQQPEDPPLQRKKTKPMPSSGYTSPTKSRMDAESNY